MSTDLAGPPTQPESRQPSTNGASLTLEAPRMPHLIRPEEASRIAPGVTDEQRATLDTKARQLFALMSAQSVTSAAADTPPEAIRSLCEPETLQSSEILNSLSQASTRPASHDLVDELIQASESLLNLRRAMKKLDPTQTSLKPKKIFGIFRNDKPIRSYFDKYQDAQTELDLALQALVARKNELDEANTILNLEEKQLWETMGQLNQCVYLVEQLETLLTARLAETESLDASRDNTLRQNLPADLNQKRQSVLAQLAVSIQGYLVINFIIKINLELIKGLKAASEATVSALQTAVLTASKLTGQTIVLDQIAALTEPASDLNTPLDKSSTHNNEPKLPTAHQPEDLARAFANLYEIIDLIEKFKTESLAQLNETITVLKTEITESLNGPDQTEGTQPSEGDSSLDLPAPTLQSENDCR